MINRQLINKVRSALIDSIGDDDRVLSMTYVGSNAGDDLEIPSRLSSTDLDLVVVVDSLTVDTLNFFVNSVKAIAKKCSVKRLMVRPIFDHGPFFHEINQRATLYLHAMISDRVTIRDDCSVVISEWRNYPPSKGIGIDKLVEKPTSVRVLLESRYGPKHCRDAIKKKSFKCFRWIVKDDEVEGVYVTRNLNDKNMIEFCIYAVMNSARLLARLEGREGVMKDESIVEFLRPKFEKRKWYSWLEEIAELKNDYRAVGTYENLDTITVVRETVETVTDIVNIIEHY